MGSSRVEISSTREAQALHLARLAVFFFEASLVVPRLPASEGSPATWRRGGGPGQLSLQT
jgi:hypothetical protein